MSSCMPQPRGRWVLARYLGVIGTTSSLPAFLYEVVDSRLPEIATGDHIVVVSDEELAADENQLSFIHADKIYAKWDDAFDLPIPVYDTIYGTLVDENVVSAEWTAIDIAVVEAQRVHPGITDIASGDRILVRRSQVVRVGKHNAYMHLLFRAEDVLARCPSISITSPSDGPSDIGLD